MGEQFVIAPYATFEAEAEDDETRIKDLEAAKTNDKLLHKALKLGKESEKLLERQLLLQKKNEEKLDYDEIEKQWLEGDETQILTDDIEAEKLFEWLQTKDNSVEEETYKAGDSWNMKKLEGDIIEKKILLVSKDGENELKKRLTNLNRDKNIGISEYILLETQN